MAATYDTNSLHFWFLPSTATKHVTMPPSAYLYIRAASFPSILLPVSFRYSHNERVCVCVWLTTVTIRPTISSKPSYPFNLFSFASDSAFADHCSRSETIYTYVLCMWQVRRPQQYHQVHLHSLQHLADYVSNYSSYILHLHCAPTF